MGLSRLLRSPQTRHASTADVEPEPDDAIEADVADEPDAVAPPRLRALPALAPTPVREEGVMGTVIAFANQKGGVAKTTTTLNLGVALAELGQRVLLIDLDPQGNLTMSQGFNPDAIERSMFDVLVHRLPITEIIEQAEADIAVASIDLAGAE